MKENLPTQDEWSRLYEAAIRIKEMAPWEWMTETELFGVQDPETKELGFVSVMGMLGEHYSIAVYRGAEGLYKFWNFQELGVHSTAQDLLKLPQLQASYENRGELTKQDRQKIKELGLKFRGRNAWPMFRSYRPGYYPWYLEQEEARLLTYALEQLEQVAPRVQENPEMLEMEDLDYLVRVRRKGTWEDEVMEIAPPEPVPVSIMMDMQALARLKRIRRSVKSIEIDCFMLPGGIGERGERPYYAYTLLIVESKSGMILGNELLDPRPGLEEMYGRVPMTVVQLLTRANITPKQIKVPSSLLHQLLQPLEKELGCQVKPTPRLPNLETVKASLMQWMGGR